MIIDELEHHSLLRQLNEEQLFNFIILSTNNITSRFASPFICDWWC